MYPNILDYYADLHAPYLHALGSRGTRVLLSELALRPGERVLEIGFGTGQTLVEIGARHPGVQLYGLEKSPAMLAVAQRRLRFSGLRDIGIQPMPEAGGLPFGDAFFQKIYCESVLAILPEADFENLLGELHRALAPGGLFVCNESIWRDGTPPEYIREINRICLEHFGIPQACERPAYRAGWRRFFENAGFGAVACIPLEGLRPAPACSAHPALLRSALFSKLRKARRFFQPAWREQARRLRVLERSFARYGLYLEGVVFKLAKDH